MRSGGVRSSFPSLWRAALRDAADRAQGTEAALARSHREQSLSRLGEQGMDRGREVGCGGRGAGGRVGGKEGLERTGAVGVERKELQGPEREPSGLEGRTLAAGAKREEVERQLEVGDQHLGARALPPLAALVVEDAGPGRSSVDAVQRAAEVDRPLAGEGRGELEVRSELLLGGGGAHPGERVELARAEEALQRGPRARLGERPQPGVAGGRAACVLASGGLDCVANEITGQRCWIRLGEIEREEALHQLLERLVEELSAAARVELLRAVLGRLEPEHLASEALERAVREGGEAGGREGPLGGAAEPRLDGGEQVLCRTEPSAVGRGRAKAGACLESLGVDGGEGPRILEPGGSAHA